MKTRAEALLKEYEASHENPLNQKIHLFCVPLIFWSLLAFFWSLNPTAAAIISVPFLFFYIRLGLKYFVQMLIIWALSFGICFSLDLYNISILPLAIGVFVLAWIGQFYGHHVEGKRPSFLEDLRFLLIGPLWTISKLFRQNK